MRTEFIDLSDTRKNLVVEVPSGIVDAEIDRVARSYGRAARIPGFRPGKVPPRLVRQRFHDQILHDVARKLIPRVVDEALRERGVEPVETPNIRDVVVEEGQPLKFTASFETVPAIDPGDYRALSLRRPPVAIEAGAVEQALTRLRERAARFDPVDDRPIESGDPVMLDLTRRVLGGPGGQTVTRPPAAPETHENITVELGAPVNPPGFDRELIGLRPGDSKEFTLADPGDDAATEPAGTSVYYKVVVKAIKRRVVPDLDDEFARDVGPFDSAEALRARVTDDLQREAERDADRRLRVDLLKQMASRVTFELPEALVTREVDRRVEEFVRRLIEQQVDPMKAGLDWEELRARQRDPAIEALRGALVLDEVARRERLAATAEDVAGEVARLAERTGRTPAAVRARLEQEGGISRLYTGLRREKAIDFLLSHATIAAV